MAGLIRKRRKAKARLKHSKGKKVSVKSNNLSHKIARKKYKKMSLAGFADLPSKYDRELIVLQVRDPKWLYAYWQVREATYVQIKKELGELYSVTKKVLRVYDVSHINFNGSNAHRFFDIDITPGGDNWYIDTQGSGRSWCVDFGLRLPEGRFITIVRSNVVTTPLDEPSCIVDENWRISEELFIKLYGLAVGLDASSVNLKVPWVQLQKQQLSSGGISSCGLSPAKVGDTKGTVCP